MMKLRRLGVLAVAGLAGVGLVAMAPAVAADKKQAAAAEKPAGAPKYTNEEMMDKFHKGKEKSVFAIVTSGKGTPEQKHALVEGYEALAQNKPGKGDEAAWKKRVDAIVVAAKAVEKGGDAKSLTTLKNAANCKQCHDLHKE